MAAIVSYRDLEAWKAAMNLLLAAYAVARQLPQTERFELSAQMRRAAVSVPSNIAEGQATGPGGRYRHHVRIALGHWPSLIRNSKPSDAWSTRPRKPFGSLPSTWPRLVGCCTGWIAHSGAGILQSVA